MGKRTLIKALLTLTFLICWVESFGQSTPTKNGWDNLIKAISAVESKGNVNAVSGKHVGILQISPVVVDDCNRINKLNKRKERYKYGDRYNKEKSIRMFNCIQDFYNPSHDFEAAIRLWNGGSGWRQHPRKTDKYYQKVMKKFKEINN